MRRRRRSRRPSSRTRSPCRRRPAFSRHVLELEVALVAVERVRQLADQVAAAVVADRLLPAALREVDVELAVAVVVEDAGAGAGALDDVARARGRRSCACQVMPDFGGDVGEDGQRGPAGGAGRGTRVAAARARQAPATSRGAAARRAPRAGAPTPLAARDHEDWQCDAGASPRDVPSERRPRGRLRPSARRPRSPASVDAGACDAPRRRRRVEHGRRRRRAPSSAGSAACAPGPRGSRRSPAPRGCAPRARPRCAARGRRRRASCSCTGVFAGTCTW